jgi:GTP cyclohydrolase I
MGSGSPPAPKPSAIPSHMLNGNSPLQSSTAPGSGSGTRVRDARERESLNSSIQSSFAPRVPIEFESLDTGSAPAGHATASEIAADASNHSTLTLRYDQSWPLHGHSFQLRLFLTSPQWPTNSE